MNSALPLAPVAALTASVQVFQVVRPRAPAAAASAARAAKAGSSIAGVTGPSTTAHHSAASCDPGRGWSAPRARTPRPPPMPSAARRSRTASIGHLVHEAGVEDVRARARRTWPARGRCGRSRRGARARRGRRPAAPPRPSRPGPRATRPPCGSSPASRRPASERWPSRFDSPSPLAVVSRLWCAEARRARRRGPRRSGSAPPCW